MSRVTVLVLGGTGVFGGLACRRLARDPAIRLLIGGRSPAKAEALALAIHREVPGAEAVPFAVDRTRGLRAKLADSGAAVVLHAAGPFQGQDYGVAEAAIAQGLHYLDLADGRDFVAGFGALDAAARRAGVLAVCGASSVPGLSAAVVDDFVPAFAELETIAVGITPGNRAPRGRAVVEAILGAAGRPHRRWQDGAWHQVHGWQDLSRRRIGGLGRRWFSACDVPDLALFPARYAGVRTVTFHAGLELSLPHLGLWALSWPVRWGWIGSLAPASGLLHRAAGWLAPFGSDRGAMFVELTGRDGEGRRRRSLWTLIAGSGHGPFVPVTPAVLLAGRLARGEIARRGAGPCLDLFTLEDFAAAVADLDIDTVREDRLD